MEITLIDMEKEFLEKKHMGIEFFFMEYFKELKGYLKNSIFNETGKIELSIRKRENDKEELDKFSCNGCKDGKKKNDRIELEFEKIEKVERSESRGKILYRVFIDGEEKVGIAISNERDPSAC